ncbi:hypothetical protein RCL1_007650 [Eukaryota sp. TZLM3-RCL]
MRIFLFITCLVAISLAYSDFQLSAPWQSGNTPTLPAAWESKGSVHYSSDYCFLTPKMKNLKGLLYNVHSFSAKAFEITTDLLIEGTKLGGSDGMAVGFTSSIPSIGSVLGLSHTSAGVFIGIDTYNNAGRFYSKSGEANPTGSRIFIGKLDGTTIPSHSNDYVETEIASCYADIRNLPTKLTIKYIGGVLSVYVLNEKTASTGGHTPCVKATIDLPSNFYLSFSAMTSILADQHSIRSIKYRKLLTAEDPVSSSKVPHHTETSRSEPVHHQETPSPTPSHPPEYTTSYSSSKPSSVNSDDISATIKSLQSSVSSLEATIKSQSRPDQTVLISKVDHLSKATIELSSVVAGFSDKLTKVQLSLDEKISQETGAIVTILDGMKKSIKSTMDNQKEIQLQLSDGSSSGGRAWLLILAVQSVCFVGYYVYKNHRGKKQAHLY